MSFIFNKIMGKKSCWEWDKLYKKNNIYENHYHNSSFKPPWRILDSEDFWWLFLEGGA